MSWPAPFARLSLAELIFIRCLTEAFRYPSRIFHRSRAHSRPRPQGTPAGESLVPLGNSVSPPRPSPPQVLTRGQCTGYRWLLWSLPAGLHITSSNHSLHSQLHPLSWSGFVVKVPPVLSPKSDSQICVDSFRPMQEVQGQPESWRHVFRTQPITQAPCHLLLLVFLFPERQRPLTARSGHGCECFPFLTHGLLRWKKPGVAHWRVQSLPRLHFGSVSGGASLLRQETKPKFCREFSSP